MEKFFSCDWGTTAFRLRLVEVAGLKIIAEESNQQGIAETYQRWKQSGRNEELRLTFYLNIIQQHIKLIEQKLNPREIYVEKLNSSNDIDKQVAQEMEKEFWNELQKRLDLAKQNKLDYQYQPPEEAWRKLKKVIDIQNDFNHSPETKGLKC